MSSTLTNLTLVASPDRMDKAAFAMHMTYRHHDSLGGLDSLEPERLSDAVEAIYRSFHARLHTIRVDLEHEHAA